MVVPKEVKIEGDQLISCWRPWRRVRVRPDILEDFLDLDRTRDPGQVLRFARRWGTLQLCEHGVPMFHSRQDPGVIRAGECSEVSLAGSAGSSQEPIARWFALAEAGAAARRAASVVRHGARHAPGDLAKLWALLPPHFRVNDATLANDIGTPADKVSSPTIQMKHALAGSIEKFTREWMTYGGVRPMVEWNHDEWRVGFSTGDRVTTFGAIAAELLLDIAGLRSLTPCKSCTGFFRPESHRERSFCPECRGTNRQWAYLKREQRKASKVGGHGGGTPPEKHGKTRGQTATQEAPASPTKKRR